MNDEIWKDIKGYEGSYQVSNYGRIKSFYHGKERILCDTDVNGYRSVQLGRNCRRYVHRLVAEAFIHNPENLPQINHKNEIKNDNRVENLEWCSAKYNTNYGTRNDKVSKPVIQIDKDKNVIIRLWKSISEVVRELGFCQSAISLCCLGKHKTSYGFIWKFAEQI